jgi:hypothetical protein
MPNSTYVEACYGSESKQASSASTSPARKSRKRFHLGLGWLTTGRFDIRVHRSEVWNGTYGTRKSSQDLDTSWYMYPALHDSVSRLLEEDDLSFTSFAIDEGKGSIEKYDTNIMGRFKCKNRGCSKTDGGAKKLLLRYECVEAAFELLKRPRSLEAVLESLKNS